jgi:hypothetical protein
MVLKSTLAIVVVGVVWLVAPRGAAAQSCSGPGAVYGVTSYECDKCGMSLKDGRPQFIFNTEPKILETEAGSVLKPGDVVVSVGTHRITTPEGSRLFTYPPPRSVVRLEVRRDGKPVVTVGEVKVDCTAHRTHSGPAASTPGGTSVDVKTGQTPPGYTVQLGAVDVETGRFGFALGCRPSCTRVKGPNGVEYWKFDAPPPVVAIRPGSAAERSGMRVGDIVIEIDGKPVMSPEGNQRLFVFPTEGGRIQLTLERSGKRLTYTLSVPK